MTSEIFTAVFDVSAFEHVYSQFGNLFRRIISATYTPGSICVRVYKFGNVDLAVVDSPVSKSS